MREEEEGKADITEKKTKREEDIAKKRSKKIKDDIAKAKHQQVNISFSVVTSRYLSPFRI